MFILIFHFLLCLNVQLKNKKKTFETDCLMARNSNNLFSTTIHRLLRIVFANVSLHAAEFDHF
jgi:hypothetical protein